MIGDTPGTSVKAHESVVRLPNEEPPPNIVNEKVREIDGRAPPPAPAVRTSSGGRGRGSPASSAAARNSGRPRLSPDGRSAVRGSRGGRGSPRGSPRGDGRGDGRGRGSGRARGQRDGSGRGRDGRGRGRARGPGENNENASGRSDSGLQVSKSNSQSPPAESARPQSARGPNGESVVNQRDSPPLMGAAAARAALSNTGSQPQSATTSESSTEKPKLVDVVSLAIKKLQREGPGNANSSQVSPTRSSDGIEIQVEEDIVVEIEKPAEDPDSKNGEPKELDYLKDPQSEMTYSRRLALFLMTRYKWYNPRLGAEPVVQETTTEHDDDSVESETNQAYPFKRSQRENPVLEKAWAYFEHVALDRYVYTNTEPKPKKNIVVRAFRRVFCKGNQTLQRSEPGERYVRTKLYHPIFTPHNQLGDFGLGVGLYFSTIRAIALLTFVAGMVNIPNFIYFSNDFNGSVPQNVKLALKGSATCVNTVWVPCTNCADEIYQKDKVYADGRVNTTEVGGSNYTFVLRNNCESPKYEQAYVNYATLLVVMLGTVALDMYIKRKEVAFDEDEQTAQDYSILIENPPGDATNPQEWHDFFRDIFGAHVTTCTIAVDNDMLVRSLVERRELLRKIEMMVEPGTSLDTLTLAGIAAKIARERRSIGNLMSMVSPGVPELFGKVVVANARVQGLAQQDYPATKIFITFETEADQRKVLTALNYGSRDIAANRISAAADPKHLFRGKLLLHAIEPDEPNTVRWQDLNEKFKDKLRQQILTAFCTLMAILAIAFLVRLTNNRLILFTSFAIAIFNSIFPMFAKFLTDLEAHASEGDKQRSLYCKIAIFRWVNTAIVITIITPFTSTLTEGKLINQIYTLFYAEIVTTNAIQLLDPFGHLQRHFLAPRAATQDAMNILMQGQAFELAERYTNMTKILFLALWYCAIYPGGLFMCSIALLISYFVDRFSLMRTWKRQPQLGPKMSEFSRQYFFPLALVAMSMLCSYWWAGFPFDNICEDEGYNSTYYVGNYTLDNNTVVEVKAGDPVYKFCSQDFFRYRKYKNASSYPFTAHQQIEGQEWMTPEQENITYVFGWTSVAVLAIVAFSFMWGWFGVIQGMWKGTYSPRGDDQGINFSDVTNICTYVPQIVSPVFSYPLLACNIDKIDKELLDWTDPDRPDFVFYDLTRDAEVLLRGMDVSNKVVFNQISHWPPPGKEQAK